MSPRWPRGLKLTMMGTSLWAGSAAFMWLVNRWVYEAKVVALSGEERAALAHRLTLLADVRAFVGLGTAALTAVGLAMLVHREPRARLPMLLFGSVALWWIVWLAAPYAAHLDVRDAFMRAAPRVRVALVIGAWLALIGFVASRTPHRRILVAIAAAGLILLRYGLAMWLTVQPPPQLSNSHPWLWTCALSGSVLLALALLLVLARGASSSTLSRSLP